jgi:hypothetical protein
MHDKWTAFGNNVLDRSVIFCIEPALFTYLLIYTLPPNSDISGQYSESTLLT